MTERCLIREEAKEHQLRRRRPGLALEHLAGAWASGPGFCVALSQLLSMAAVVSFTLLYTLRTSLSFFRSPSLSLAVCVQEPGFSSTFPHFVCAVSEEGSSCHTFSLARSLGTLLCLRAPLSVSEEPRVVRLQSGQGQQRERERELPGRREERENFKERHKRSS